MTPSNATSDSPSDTTPDTPSDTTPDGRVDPKLLEILICPVTRTTLRYDSQAQELISDAARLAYPIRSGIPILLPEEARSLDTPAPAAPPKR